MSYFAHNIGVPDVTDDDDIRSQWEGLGYIPAGRPSTAKPFDLLDDLRVLFAPNGAPEFGRSKLKQSGSVFHSLLFAYMSASQRVYPSVSPNLGLNRALVNWLIPAAVPQSIDPQSDLDALRPLLAAIFHGKSFRAEGYVDPETDGVHTLVTVEPEDEDYVDSFAKEQHFFELLGSHPDLANIARRLILTS